MEGLTGQSLLVAAIPLLGAALGTFFWSKPQFFKIWGLGIITTTWLLVTFLSSTSDTPWTISFFLMHLILSAGFLTALGQHPNKETPISLCLMLLFTGLGLGFVANEGPSSQFILCGILGLLVLAFVRHKRQDHDIPWMAIGVLALGILALLLSVVTSGPLQILTMLVPLAILWPLIPVQGAFVASVSHLPGILPSFLTVLLPSLGFYGLIHLLPAIPESALNLLGVVALITALYGSLLALSQDSMDTLLAHAQMALGGILWWYLATSQSVSSGAVAYLGGLSLVTCGLFLASHSIRTRFGHLDLRASHGLANIMPCLSTLFVLFITAALGLPMFTLFSAFMEMLLGMSSTPVGSLMVVLLIWLMASWYFPRLMQQVLFGRPSPQCKGSHDLYVYERFSLILLLALLIILGMAPSTWFGATDPTPSMAQLTLGISQE